MYLRALIAIMTGLLICGCKSRAKITEEVSFAVADAFSDHSIGRSIADVTWATDSVLIATAGNRKIQAFDPNSG
jgi:hypothetical protein